MEEYTKHKQLGEVAFWPGMWSDVKQYVRTCAKCETLKSDNQKHTGKLQQITTNHPNQMLRVDLMVPLTRSTNRNEYLLVFVDYYSRWVELFQMHNASAQNIASISLTWWDVPDFIFSDRTVQFVSSVFRIM